MKINITHVFHKNWGAMVTMLLLFLFGQRASAQITTMDCQNTFSYCSLDTVTLAPSNTVLYTNFVWYGGSVAPGNEITAGTAASFNVDPNRLGNNTIYVSAPGGTYILTSEYATPGGCATKNDTLIINFLTVPDLATTTDTICASAGQTADLASLVTDNNGVAGTTPTWYPTLADAENQTNALGSTIVGPTATTTYYVRKNTTATDAEGSACYDLDSVIVDVRCLSLGNYVWVDTNNNGVIEGGESPISGVTVQIFLDANKNGVLDGAEQAPLASTITNGSGLYIFEGLAPGNYIVGIPSTNFGAGSALENLLSSGTSMSSTGTVSEVPAPDVDIMPADNDDNGVGMTSGFYAGGVMTLPITLDFQSEPLGETPNNATVADADANLTADFGFYGMSLGNQLFADINNNGTLDVGENGISGVTVILYAADGTTVIATTTTDGSGNYLFENLPEGTYIIGVETNSPALSGQHSSDDIATSGTPETTDNDDNGVTLVGTVIQSNAVIMDAGTEPDGGNSNLYVDFGFVPDCPTITNPTGAQTICATEDGIDLTADATVNLSFVRFMAAQTGNAMYSGGTVIGGNIAPVAGTATYAFNTADFPNATNAPITYYVYAIMATPSADPTCRPYQEIQVVVNPKPTATGASITECENNLGSGQGDFTLGDADLVVLNGQTGMTVTYHATLADAQAGTPDLPTNYTASAGTIYVRVENAQGCYATAAITLTVHSKPDFTLALATVCPGENPEVTISNLLNGDAILSTTSVNGGSFNPYQASPPNITTADGLVPNAMNTITVRNENGCETAKAIAVPGVTPLVCPPVNVTVKRNGE